MAIKGIKTGSTTNKIDISALESEGNAGKFIKAGSSGPVWDSPVTGTNDGTNWTSLSVQTASGLQEYAIPSGGSGGTTLNQYTYNMSQSSSSSRARLYRILTTAKGSIVLSCVSSGNRVCSYSITGDNIYIQYTYMDSTSIHIAQFKISSDGTARDAYIFDGTSTTTWSGYLNTLFNVKYNNDTSIQ